MDPLPQWRQLPAPARAVRSIVIVPVRNEAEQLATALDALVRQVDRDGRPVPPGSYEVLLFANNCDDDSVAIAQRCAARSAAPAIHVVEATLPPRDAHIGYVRRQLMDAACQRLIRLGRDDGLIASTDADTRVAPDWLNANLREIAAGADAVGGRILTDHAHPPGVAALRIQRRDTAHALLRSRLASHLDPDPFDPWPRHHQHYGASLAVTARAYRLAGGVPAVEYLEDAALVRSIERAGLRVRRSPRVRVTTSGRLDGRAAVGLSWQLRQWSACDAAAHDPLVEDAALFAAALTARAALRPLWHDACARGRTGALTAQAAAFAARLAVPVDRLCGLLRSPRPFAELWDDIEQTRHESMSSAGRLVPLSRALADLRQMIRRAPPPR